MARGEANAPARTQDQHFAVAADEQVRDQGADKVTDAGRDDDADKGELALRGQRTTERDDNFTGNRDPRALRRHREEDGDEPARSDDLDDLMRHPAKPSS